MYVCADVFMYVSDGSVLRDLNDLFETLSSYIERTTPSTFYILFVDDKNITTT